MGLKEKPRMLLNRFLLLLMRDAFVLYMILATDGGDTYYSTSNEYNGIYMYVLEYS